MFISNTNFNNRLDIMWVEGILWLAQNKMLWDVRKRREGDSSHHINVPIVQGTKLCAPHGFCACKRSSDEYYIKETLKNEKSPQKGSIVLLPTQQQHCGALHQTAWRVIVSHTDTHKALGFCQADRMAEAKLRPQWVNISDEQTKPFYSLLITSVMS